MSNCKGQIIISGISKNTEISPLQCITSIHSYPYFHSNETNTYTFRGLETLSETYFQEISGEEKMCNTAH